MQYMINTINNDVICAVADDVVLEGLPSTVIVRTGEFGYEVDKLMYDPDSDTIYSLTDEEYLAHLKEEKLSDLKTQIMISFGNLGDAIADAVKAVKLLMKWAVEEDPGVKRDLEDYFRALLPKLEMVYPDNYAKTCTASYADNLVKGLSAYYQKKVQVMQATTPEEIDSINLE